MNKGQLIEAVAKATNQPKTTVGTVVDATLDTITKSVKKGQKVTFTGFGTFERRRRSARVGRNPQTGEQVKIAAAKVPAFKPGKGFKEAVK